MTYLWSRECPSHEEGLDRLRAAAREAGVDLDLEVREIHTDAEAEAVRFAGSPTYLVAGRDFEPAEVEHAFRADACRAYRRADGSIGPLPEVARLTAALRAAGLAAAPA